MLDLGSGGGVDVLLSARRVGPTGFAYGLDMTDAMLELAERNRVEAKVENVRFLKGVIETAPKPVKTKRGSPLQFFLVEYGPAIPEDPIKHEVWVLNTKRDEVKARKLKKDD